MKLLSLCPIIMIGTMLCHSSEKTYDDFFLALRKVETGGKEGHFIGDNGKSIGPLQIQEACWKDAKVDFPYQDCHDFEKAKEVAIKYWKRYCLKDYENKNWEVLARIWNGGPRGHTKNATIKYWEKVKGFLNEKTNDG